MRRWVNAVTAILAVTFAAVGLQGCSGCADEDAPGGGGSGIGISDQGRLQVEPETLTMPGSEVGVQVTAHVVVSNIGGEALTLTGARIDPGSASEFTAGVADETVLGPDDQTRLSVHYTPVDVGQDTAELVIESTAGEARVRLNSLTAAGAIYAVPNPIDFGNVITGEEVTRHTDITNGGNAPFDITWLALEVDTSPDYRIAGLGMCPPEDLPESGIEGCVEATGTIVMAPHAVLRVLVSYTPRGANRDVGKIYLETTEPDHPEFRVRLTGAQPTPSIVIVPDRIDFGSTAAEGREESFTIHNSGTTALLLDSVTQAFPGNEAFTVLNAPARDTGVAPGGQVTVKILFLPPNSPDEQFTLLSIDSDDPLRPKVSLELLGRLDAPIILVRPDVHNFAQRATGIEVRHELTATNVGSRDLEVTGVVLAEGSHVDFGLAELDQVLGILAPGETRAFQATFTPTEGVDRKEAIVQVLSTDPFFPQTPVTLRGRDGGAPRCNVRAAEGAKNYGLVGYGRTKELPIRFIGTGTVDCEVISVELVSPIPGFQVEDFDIVPPVPGAIPTGAQESVVVAFNPERPILPFPDFGRSVDLVLTFRSPDGEEGTAKTTLTGSGGESRIAVLPEELDFGLITLGCRSQTLRVSVYNTGIAELTLERVHLEGCGPEFAIVELPELPVTVVPARPADVQVRYEPQDMGPDNCEIVFDSTAENEPSLSVPLRGEGTRLSEVTDRFIQTTGQLVDVLFVVDNSGSMGDEQENLADNMIRFTDAAAVWENDFHIGVTTTQVGNDELFGGNDPDPNRGKLVGDPRIVTIDDDRGAFERNVQVGANGGGAQESGLEAARLALSNPWAREEPRGDCANDDACEDGEECEGGHCVGYNRDFLRDDASLELVFVSDEEDQSPARVDFYIDFFRSIKGFRNEGLIHASAIAGDPGRGCETANGSADAGDRYNQVVQALNGSFHSICAREFDEALADIGNRAFGLRVQFFLSRVADPETISVEVDGQEVAEGERTWHYDVDSNSIVFDDAGVPEPGDHVDISYSARCFR